MYAKTYYTYLPYKDCFTRFLREMRWVRLGENCPSIVYLGGLIDPM